MSSPSPASISIVLGGVFVHLSTSGNNNAGLLSLTPPVNYRIIAPQSVSLNEYDDPSVGEVDLGSIAPLAVVGAAFVNGPAVITISATSSGTPSLPPTTSAPSLSSLLPPNSGFTPDPATYASAPLDNSIYLDLNIPGSFSAVVDNAIAFTATDVAGLSITVQTSAGGPTPIQVLPNNYLVLVNFPDNPSSNTPNADETLLGFLGLASSIPGGVTPPSAIEHVNFWSSPQDPGCSNSQWP